MDRHADFDDVLRGAGLRVTAPRVAILAVLGANPHSDTDSIARAVREELGSVSHQSVYDGLRALTSAGIVRRFQPMDSVARYELQTWDNHHHIVCRSCGTIVDVECVVGDAPCLTAPDDADFEIGEAEVIYWGTCPTCKTQIDFPEHRV